MLSSTAAIIAAYAVGSIPVAWLAGRASGVDVRERGSGNVGASNVFQSVSRWLVVPVGVAQIVQGCAAVMLARVVGGGDGLPVACGLAAVVANDWNPWLRFTGGRGIGATIGVLLALTPAGLAAFIAVAVAGVALRAIPQGVALGLIGAPVAAAIAGASSVVVAGAAILALIALAKRVLANGPPAPGLPRPDVWLLRLLYDRDIADRDAWVRGRGRIGRDKLTASHASVGFTT
jgi:glycerol-3-phosphate acyltransferase PlsY